MFVDGKYSGEYLGNWEACKLSEHTHREKHSPVVPVQYCCQTPQRIRFHRQETSGLGFRFKEVRG
eukprot:1657569-Amphidinium_carterae.1